MTTTQPKRQPIPFGKYLLLDRINIGGMAEVWRGKHFGAGGFERLVAIKRILPNIAEDDEFISMFIDEAKISVQLTHANIAQIYELGQIASSYFIAMEYIPGKDMRAIFDRCRKKAEPAPIPLVAYCVSKMCEGLDYAHRKKDGMGRDLNIVHRDISPQNVLISYEGEVKVIDFGIAKAAGKATKTQAGILKGKFGYMSPEQIRGLTLDRRSDVFAIGVCLYEMLTGERLFVGDSDFSVLEKVRKAEVAPPSTYNRKIPDNLEKIVLKALARDVDERYQYASELGDDLQRFLITSETIFGRKDLMQYMKSTFAEDVEREKQRLQDYASIPAPDGMLAAIEAGFSGSSPSTSVPALTPPVPAPIEPVRPPPQQTAVDVRRSPSLIAMPKLTAAPAAPPPKDDEGVATMLVDSSEYFNDNDEPKTQPGANVGRAVTPLESQTVNLGEGEVPITGKTAVIGPPPGSGAPPPRLSSPNIPVVTPSPNIQVRPSVFAMPAVGAPEPGQGGLPGRPAPAGRAPGDGLPPIARPDRPPGGPPMLGPSSGAPGMGTPRPAPMPGRPAPAPVPPPAPVVPEPIAARGSTGGINRIALFGGIGAVAVILLGVLAFFALRSEPLGFIMVELPPELRSKAQVKFNAQDVAPTSGDILQQVPAGDVLVTVSVEGYKPFEKPVSVVAGTQVTRVVAVLEPLVKTTMMVLSTEPADAEVKLNGKVIRAQGAKDILIKDVPALEGMELVVSAPGYQSVTQRVSAPDSGQPLQVSARLEASEVEVKVESEPEGATIVASGKDLGKVTPAVVKVPAGTRQLTLKMKCFEDANLQVNPPSSSEPTVVKGSLKKQPGCK